MKSPLLLAALLVGITCSIPCAAELPDAPRPASDQLSDVEKLTREYEQRRAQALRPVNTWYRAQLEQLGQKLEKEGQAVAETRAKAAEMFWRDDQPELQRALLLPAWNWRSEMDSAGVALTFSPDGSVHHAGLNGTWKITGPNEVTVRPDDDAPYVLRFNASLTAFLGDRRGVGGDRKSAK